MIPSIEPVPILLFSNTGWQEQPQNIISEAYVLLTVNSEPWLSFACTPFDLEELAAGFLFTEGFINNKEEIASLTRCADNSNIDVWLTHPVKQPENWHRTSGCAGGNTNRTLDMLPEAVTLHTSFRPEELFGALEQLYKSQSIYHETRGIHCSATSNGSHLNYIAEDIGRHNTLDKLAGKLLLKGDQDTPRIIVTTGRVSSEMLLKSARMKAEAVVSRTSPTSLSVQLAKKLGITLVGYATRTNFLVYSHPDRLVIP